MEKKTTIDSIVRGFVILIGEHQLPTDLAVLNLGEFDIILGIDWLTTWHGTIDCVAKKVYFHPPDQGEFYF